MEKQEPHKHNFNKIGFIREVGTASPSELLRVDVAPQMINRIILIRSCDCKAVQAFECGDRDTMRELYKRLVREGKHENEDTGERADTIRP